MAATGIDLAIYHDDVRRILYAKFSRKIARIPGVTPDDVLQEVYRGILARNRGTCPWDPEKSSLGTYVYMVCSCILSNFYRKQRSRLDPEMLGIADPMSDDCDRDVALADLASVPEHYGRSYDYARDQVEEVVAEALDLDQDGRDAVMLLAEGWKGPEIEALTGLSAPQVVKLRRRVREALREALEPRRVA